MKKFVFSLLAALPLLAAAQKSYTLSGHISGLQSPAMAYLSYGQGKEASKDSVAIKNGVFQFKGRVAEPVQAFLSVSHGKPGKKNAGEDYFPFFIENSKIEIRAADSIKNATIKGSVAEADSRRIAKSIRGYTDIIIKLNDEFRGKPKDEAYQKASDSVTYLVKEIKNLRMKFIRDNPNSFIALQTYSNNVVDKNFDPATMEPMFYHFSTALRSSPLGLRTEEKIASAKRRQTGIMATDFTQNDLNDKAFTLSSLRGKYVLVDFWASWCVPCRAENPNLAKAYEQLKGKNFEVVSVSLDQSKAAWEGAVKKDGMPWIHVCDLQGWQNAVATLYNIDAVPQNLLINPEGMIVARNLRGEDVLQKLSAFIK